MVGAKAERPLREMVEKVCAKRELYQTAYACPGAARTTNAVDRLMDHQGRLRYARRYLHGTDAQARLALRAQALQWNFHPYSARVRRENPTRHSPFADLNGLCITIIGCKTYSWQP
jgi:hypothetical protein